MLLSMLCWGSWANTIKLTPGWPIQLFYWDYVVGILLGSVAWGVALGGGAGVLFAGIASADSRALLLALAGGVIFNAANLLLVVAIEIAGLAVAFPLGIGLALVIGVILNYIFSPAGNPWLLFGGVVLVAIAIVIDAVAYRRREVHRTRVTARGILLSLVAGVLMGLFYPLVARSLHGTHALGPYSVVPVFALGIAICSIPANLWLMRHPLPEQQPLQMSQYFAGQSAWHLWGLLGGAIWCSGAVLNFAASQARFVGPAISYAIGQGATMVSAAWGVFVWHEFRGAPAGARRLIPLMFLFFLLGLSAIALAPNY
jgi:glucose uptake protein